MKDIKKIYKEVNYIIPLKNQLLNLDDDDIIKMYSKSERYYYNFLIAVVFLIEEDAEFLTLTNIIPNRILEVINHFRYQYTKKEIIDVTNSIIQSMNILKTMPAEDRRNISIRYTNEQAVKRGVTSTSIETIVKSMAYDAIAIEIMKKNNYENIKNKELFLMSISYFIDDMPLILNELDAIDKVTKVCDDYKKECKLLDFNSKSYAKFIKKLVLCIDDRK